MTLTHKVAFNTGFQFLSKIITTGLSLVLVAALTRYLGVDGFGDYTTIFAYVSFAAVLADFGFFWIMLREISKDEKNTEKIVNNTMTLRGVLGIVVFTLAYVISFFISEYSDSIRLGIAVIGFSWFFTTINSTYVGLFQAKLEMYKSAITEVIGRVVIFVLVMLFIKLHYSLFLILSAYAIGNIVNFIASIAMGYKYIHFRLAFDFDFWKKMFIEALPMGIVLVLGLIYFKIDTVMLSMMKSNTDVGIYGAPYKILEVLQIVPSIFMGNVFPILTNYIATGDKRIQATMQKAFDFLVILACPIVAGGIVLATPIIQFIAGEEFVTATTVGSVFGLPATAPTILQILIFAVGISFISIKFNNTVIALGKQKELVSTYIILVFINIGLNLLWIPKYSYMGAAASTLITEILVLILTARIVYKYIDFKISFGILFKSIIASIIMGLVLYFIPGMNLFIGIVLGMMVYAVALFVMGGINKDNIALMIKKQ